MSKGKPRWYPDKPQNNKPLYCPRFEEYGDNDPIHVYCHGLNVEDARTCQGNPHNCIKTYYRRAASRSNKQINNGEFRLK